MTKIKMSRRENWSSHFQHERERIRQQENGLGQPDHHVVDIPQEDPIAPIPGQEEERPAGKKKSPSWVWLIAGALILLLVLGILYFAFSGSSDTEKVETPAPIQNHQAVAPAPPVKEETKKSPPKPVGWCGGYRWLYWLGGAATLAVSGYYGYNNWSAIKGYWTGPTATKKPEPVKYGLGLEGDELMPGNATLKLAVQTM